MPDHRHGSDTGDHWHGGKGARELAIVGLDLQKAVAEIASRRESIRVHDSVEGSVRSHQVDIALRIGRGPGAALPDRSFFAIRRDIENGDLSLTVRASYPMIHPLYGLVSQCDVQVM